MQGCVKLRRVWRRRQFLFSDQPEYFLAGNGIPLQEDVQPGIVRLYLDRVPTPTPGRNFHQIAKTAFAQFLKPKPASAAT